MPHPLLFCIAEEAKLFVRKALTLESDGGDIFYLVESKSGLIDREERFRHRLAAEDESFETDFIGASEGDCREWALEKQLHNRMIQPNFIAIADKRSAIDDTFTIHFYFSGRGHEFGSLGVLPREPNTWYTFRIQYKEVDNILACLTEVTRGVVYPVYFGRKDELTDENGIFDVARADAIFESGTASEY